MGYLEQIQRSVDFIETNLDDYLSIGEVARVGGMSQWHFQRMFKAITGETIKTYIRSRRLDCSLDKLLGSDKRIIDIAFEAGFESQESYTRAFKKAFGINPGAFRSVGHRRMFLRKVQFDIDYLHHITEDLSLEPTIAVQPAKRFVGLKTTYYGSDSDKNNIAEKLPGLWDEFMVRLGEISHAVEGTGYGIIRQTAAKTDELEYYAAVEVAGIGDAPSGMDVVETNEQIYATFAHRGEVRNLDHTVNYIYSTWLLSSGRRHAQTVDIEIYGREYHPTSAESIIYYAIPLLADDE